MTTTYADAVKAALATVNVPYFHNFAHEQDADYIVWSEATTGGLHADGKIRYRSQRIAVDYFTKSEYSTIAFDISDALENEGFAVDAEILPIYEEETGYTHYAITATWA